MQCYIMGWHTFEDVRDFVDFTEPQKYLSPKLLRSSIPTATLLAHPQNIIHKIYSDFCQSSKIYVLENNWPMVASYIHS